MISPKIRSPNLNDIETIIEIERESFPRPWDESVFFQLALSSGRYPIDETTVVIMDIMEKVTVVGYVVWEEYSEDKHGHILNLAVHEEHRRQGYGTRLLEHALDSLRLSQMETCELEVRESNHWARHMYEKAGMMAVDRRQGYYESEDAIIYSIEFD